jgi:hypothetical protein
VTEFAVVSREVCGAVGSSRGLDRLLWLGLGHTIRDRIVVAGIWGRAVVVGVADVVEEA